MPSVDQWIAIAGVGATIAAAVIAGLFTLAWREAERPKRPAREARPRPVTFAVSQPARSQPEPTIRLVHPRTRPHPGEEADEPTLGEWLGRLRRVDRDPGLPTSSMGRYAAVARPSVPDGTWKVQPGETVFVLLDAAPGERVAGQLGGNAAFEYFIVDARNYARLRNGASARVAQEGEGKSVYGIDWQARGETPYHLVLQACRKKYARSVEVHLRTYARRD